MADINSAIPELEGDGNLISAAQQIVKAIGLKKNLTDVERKVLAELGSKLSNIIPFSDESKAEAISRIEVISEIEERFYALRERIMSWEADESMIWEAGLEEISEYLKAVSDAQELIRSLEGSLSSSKDDEKSDILRRVYDVLQTSMVRLEEEFIHILVQNQQTFEPERMSFRSSEEDIVDEASIISIEEDSGDDVPQRDSITKGSEEYLIDLVCPNVIPYLKRIANLMFVSKHDQECSQAFICVRKDALDECLRILEIQKLSIEDVLRMEWASLASKIKRWVWAIRVFVRVYLNSEKWLHDQIFGELGVVHSFCFIEASKASILRLLNFGAAVAISPRKPEKLFGILGMYEVLVDLLPSIETLYPDEAGSCVSSEYYEVISSLGDSVRATFLDFENAIASNASVNPFAGGGIHPLTRYVMNYIRILTDYCETLNLLLEDRVPEDRIYGSADTSPTLGGDKSPISSSSYSASSMALHFQTLMSILESNLETKSKLYKDAALQHFFLMNNIHYMAEKVKGSELRSIFGDKWIRKHNWKFQQHAMNYERATWSSILCLLKDGNQNSNSNSSKTLLKDKLKSFYLGFEEVYKTQTSWLIRDPQLREDLQISTSSRIVLAYRTFVGRPNLNISEKHIKYSADELQNYILDLFEGSQRSLPHCYKR